LPPENGKEKAMNHKKNNNIDKVVDKRSEKPLISVEDAEKIIAAFPVSIKIETVPLLAAQNRVLAADIDSPFAMPEFDF
jgi:hypothetical protein